MIHCGVLVTKFRSLFFLPQLYSVQQKHVLMLAVVQV
uniref:Uncharacterized protein n=1 Tax=Arundo donax TaxID=35708 RepID=A0A0A9G9Y9_ARUDO